MDDRKIGVPSGRDDKSDEQSTVVARHTAGPWAVERGTGVHEGWYVITARHAGMGPSSPLAKLSRVLDAVDDSAGADARLIAAAPDLKDELKKLYRAYVALLESGRDRIIDLGGTCDPVDAMEDADPALRSARAVLTKAGA